VAYGTRPQVIKSARLLPALRRRWSTIAIDTGQHYDYEMNALLYEQLGVPAPDVLLGVGSADREEQLERTEKACARALCDRRPRAVVVIGDTNSTVGCARAAWRLEMPVIHVEAGLRSHVATMVEEQNRVEVDAGSVLRCAPSRAAVQWLSGEGDAGRIVQTGDVARDVLEHAIGQVGIPRRVPGWPLAREEPYVFATLHRAELIGNDALLSDAVEALAALSLPVVLATHPRTARRFRELGVDTDRRDALRIIPPIGYLETIAAVRAAAAVVTDSGGVQREAYWLGVPCVTLRDETEWVETVGCGANRLVRPSTARDLLAMAVATALTSPRGWPRDEYGTGDAAERIASAIAEWMA
jgi:UDP-N-acetylglucosamine 2-epimerase